MADPQQELKGSQRWVRTASVEDAERLLEWLEGWSLEDFTSFVRRAREVVDRMERDAAEPGSLLMGFIGTPTEADIKRGEELAREHGWL